MTEKLLVDADETAWAIEQSILNILELVDITSPRENRERLRDEAKRTVLMLIAEVILIDGRCESGEHTFVRHLVNLGDKPEASYLRENAGLWTAVSEIVPDFFQAAVRRDTEIACSMLREIQFIGCNVAICDGDFQAKERKSVKKYVAFLEDFMEAEKSQS